MVDFTHASSHGGVANESAARSLGYVALRSHDGKRVILPVAAAAGSRVLHGLFQGLCVMQLHQSAAAATAAAVAVTNTAAAAAPTASNATSASDEQRVTEPIPIVVDEDDEGASESTEEGVAALYRSYAATFPANTACLPPSSSEPQPQSAAAPLLEVPICSLETSTLARVAEFLVVKSTLANHPHYLHEADVFGDLDRTSERDQLVAMQVLLGADFLNC